MPSPTIAELATALLAGAGSAYSPAAYRGIMAATEMLGQQRQAGERRKEVERQSGRQRAADERAAKALQIQAERWESERGERASAAEERVAEMARRADELELRKALANIKITDSERQNAELERQMAMQQGAAQAISGLEGSPGRLDVVRALAPYLPPDRLAAMAMQAAPPSAAGVMGMDVASLLQNLGQGESMSVPIPGGGRYSKSVGRERQPTPPRELSNIDLQKLLVDTTGKQAEAGRAIEQAKAFFGREPTREELLQLQELTNQVEMIKAMMAGQQTAPAGGPGQRPQPAAPSSPTAASYLASMGLE